MAALIMLNAGVAAVAAEEVATPCAETGRSLYYACSSCHGAAGEGSEPFGAPALAGLDAAYVVRQLEHYRSGVRGSDPHDASGSQMVLLARSLPDPTSVVLVACHVASLPATRPLPTLHGDPQRGRALFAPCATCHGERAAGNPSLGAPGLAQQSDWYLRAQLLAFRRCWRGRHP